MRYLDKHGNDHVMGESKSIAAVTDDDHLKWLIDEDGTITLSIDGKKMLSMDVHFYTSEDEPHRFPFERVQTEDIIYRKTHASANWRMDGKNIDEAGTADHGWEIGMKMRGSMRGSDFGIQTKVYVTHGHTNVDVISLNQVLVHVMAGEVQEEFRSNTGSMLKFSMKVS